MRKADWPLVKLSKVCDVESGAGFPLEYQGQTNQQYPFFKVGDMNTHGNEQEMRVYEHSISEEVRQKLHAKAFPANSVIFPKIGAAIATNKKRKLVRPSCVDNNVMALVPSKKINPAYLYYLLINTDLSDFASTGNPPSIRTTTIRSWEIPLPPLEEQQRIAEVLARADRLRRLRRAARELSAGYLQAVFLQMFGDPVENPMGWPVYKLGNIVAVNPPLTRKIKEPDTQVTFVPMSAVDAEQVEIVGALIRPYIDVSKGFTAFEENDVLFAKITPCMENGKIVIAKNLYNGVGFGSTEFHVLRSGTETNPEWLLWLLRRPEFREQAQRSFTGTAGQQRVPTGFLKYCEVPLPPLPLQQRFAGVVRRFERLRAQQVEAERQAEALFQSLLARAFAGGGARL